MKIEFSPPDIREKEIANVIEVLKSGWITTGSKTKEFEREIANYCNTEKVVCLNSATAAMEMTLRVLGIGEGDEVITSAYTYTSSASVIHHVGAKIVLVDTAKGSYEMDYEKLEQAITEKTKAIIAVDLASVMCNYEKIFEIVNKKKDEFKPNNVYQENIGRVIVIADAAHSLGAKYKGLMNGDVADFTSLSFQAVKNLTTAEGGAVTWRKIKDIENEEIYRLYNILSLHGQTKDAFSKSKLGLWEYDIVEPGYKCNMTDIMAAIGLAQLDRYDETLKYRKRLIETYNYYLNDTKDIEILEHYNSEKESSGHLYMIRLINKNEKERNEIIMKLGECGISSNVHYKPLPLLKAYKDLGFDIEEYPNSYNMFKNEVTLPLNSLLSLEEIKFISANLNKIINGK
ncbi:DegT/DnrJ/EryC1/StrS family aminotransferase [Clostridium sp.]|uniref:DegT/DnrJ/EryC1/StrS family aminotransferase n=1 Tax=Clostridium sp. TaxID=1506 RepID=UPI0029073C3A|nr:DegT/DnrJ/EryC1/StrS family aminotransferase [Clostridium sp.]MDU4738658.1 DegT/DnrJ/EryC1/StrS family aminotransferase [Clostridium sp.]